MLDMILALKECLALVLLTGLITGLFFAKARNKEEYEPVIDELNEKIAHTNEEIDEIEQRCESTLKSIENEEENSEKVKNEIAGLETKIDKAQKDFTTIDHSLNDIREKYASVNALLQAQTQKVNELKEKIGSFTPEALLQKETEQRDKLKELQTRLNEENEILLDITARHKNLKAQRDELYTGLEPLKKANGEIKELLEKAKQKEATIEDDLKNKISSLKDEYNGWMEKIKKYKAELLKLKES